MEYAKRFGALAMGIVLALVAYYSDGDQSSWFSFVGWVLIIVGLLVATRSRMLGFGNSMSSINGIGTTLYEKREIGPDGSYIATKWFIFFLLPIFPYSSWRIIPETPKAHFFGQITTYRRFDEVKLSKKQVLNTYLMIYLPVVVIVALVVVFSN